MTQENCTERTRPTRRELRLARQAAERATEQVAGDVRSSDVQCAEVAVAEKKSPDLNDTVVLQLDSHGVSQKNTREKSSMPSADTCAAGARTSSRCAGGYARIKSLLRSGIGGRKYAVTSIGTGFVIAALAIGSLAFNQSTQAQAVAGASVLLQLVNGSEETTPEAISASERAALSQAKQRADAAGDIAGNSSAVCKGLTSGASSVASAYTSDDFSMVYMPMKENTYTISSPFGSRISPLTGAPEMHFGVDMAGPTGTPIYAVADGVVLSTTWGGSNNNGIVIEHRVNGQVFTSRYLHSYTDQIMVKPGDEVKAGQQISAVGSSGMSTGPHLHFEMHHGAGIDTEASEPLSFLEELGAIDPSQECVG